MGWQEVPVKSFEAFVEAVSGVLPSTSEGNLAYWFRGQSNANWRLLPSLTRALRSLDVAAPDVSNVETAVLEEFRCKAHLFVSPPLLSKVRTIPCWWALMQHMVPRRDCWTGPPLRTSPPTLPCSTTIRMLMERCCASARTFSSNE